MYNLICPQCKKSFVKIRNVTKYCGYKCSGAAKKLRDISCPQCKKFFKPRLSNSQFCSRQCAGTFLLKGKTGSLSRFWKGGIHRRKLGVRRNQPSGYIEIWDGNRWIGEHRQIMEKVEGRKLKRSEHVHHINGKRDDNRIENLVVLTISQHNHHHKKEQVKNFQRDSAGKFIKKS